MAQPAAFSQRVSLNGAQLKWIAILAMVADHGNARIVKPLIQAGMTGLQPLSSLFNVIGRLAFPLFAFLIAEGAAHTHNRRKYLGRLLLFALITEIPFDLCFYGQMAYWQHQNVLFTLGLGVAGIMALDHFSGRPLLQVCSAVALCLIAQLASTDYGLIGVGLILVLYATRASRPALCLFGGSWLLASSYLYAFASAFLKGYWPRMRLAAIVQWGTQLLAYEGWALLSLALICLYNGQRGKGMNKYFFYAFYPGHMLLIWLIHQGISGLPG